MRPKVFISYSRRDALAFAEQLEPALEAAGFDAFIDRHDIRAGEDWRDRISGLIGEADSVVFVITPASISSEICLWEIARSDELGKRLLPIVPASVESLALPERLANLNHVFFYSDASSPGTGFGKGLADLAGALRTDLDWVRDHTRYGQRAAEWLAVNREKNRLLSGKDVDAAKSWMDKRNANAPEITSDVREFIKASEEAELARSSEERKKLEERERNIAAKIAAIQAKERAQRLAMGILVAGLLITVVLGGLATWTWRQAAIAETRAKGYLNLLGWVQSIESAQIDGFERCKNRVVTDEQRQAMDALCNDAIAVATLLAQADDSPSKEAAESRFWELYCGPLYAVEKFEAYLSDGESSRIQLCMSNLGDQIEYGDGDDTEALSDLVQKLADACSEFQKRIATGPLVPS